MRFNVYATIHKAQRYHLFHLSIKIGQADLLDHQQFQHIKEELQEMIQHLKEHAINEETFIHPLYYQMKEDLTFLEHQHEEIEAILEKLQHYLESNTNPSELYTLVNQLIAHYLLHIDEEEKVQQTHLWPAYTDAELKAVIDKFKQSRTVDQNEKDLAFILPCLNQTEKGLFTA